MITKAHARILRKKIEELAQPLTDADAYAVPELYPMWKVGVTYQIGDRRQWEGKLYKCVQAHTSQADWTPDVTPALWAEVADPAIEWPEWKQPTGAQDAYQEGDKVSHNELHWLSIVNNNVWEPGIYGWNEAN